ncbi:MULTISPECIES: GFA family protein [unclassified Xanthobacter]|uniref:GFA family protein n=1 Tax=unclassified Xanthobacter TaxID=2623496 RepID=UPI001EDE5F59|nr:MULTISPECIES: GFA family protein [unclassified Xanthobacter]
MAPFPAQPLVGGCLCGAVRYRIKQVRTAFWCHCTMCQKASGSAAVPWASVARDDLELTDGTLTRYASSEGVIRGFCGSCGSPILFDMACEAEVDITVGTLDQPDAVQPSHHLWTHSARAMTAGLGADLPRFAAERDPP